MTRTVFIGRMRERVELLDEPTPGARGRIGRLRHANGENVAIDHATLASLVALAERREEEIERVSGESRVGCLWA